MGKTDGGSVEQQREHWPGWASQPHDLIVTCEVSEQKAGHASLSTVYTQAATKDLPNKHPQLSLAMISKSMDCYAQFSDEEAEAQTRDPGAGDDPARNACSQDLSPCDPKPAHFPRGFPCCMWLCSM